MRKSCWVLALVFLLGLLHADARGKRKRRVRKRRPPAVALHGVRALGVEEQSMAAVLEGVRRALGRLGTHRILSDRTMRKRLKKKRVSEGASLSRVLSALRARYVLTGTLGGLGDELSLDLKLLDGKSGREIRRAAVSLPAEGAARDAALDELAIRLLAPGDWVGTLALDVEVKGASIYLDEKLVGTTPLNEPIIGLTPGKHILRIIKEDYGEFNRFVVIRYNSVARLKPDLKNNMVVGLIYERKKPKPPPSAPQPDTPGVGAGAPGEGNTFQTVMAWSFLAVGTGLTGTGVFFVVKGNETWSPVFLTAGGLTLAGALVLFLLDDRTSTAPADAGPGVSVVPALVPGGVGIGVGGRF
jgi:hypothetical protein